VIIVRVSKRDYRQAVREAIRSAIILKLNCSSVFF
jgi:hypothetical protein